MAEKLALNNNYSLTPKYTEIVELTRDFFNHYNVVFFQDAFPARFKGIHYFNEPSIFDYVFAILKQFMKEKTVSRVRQLSLTAAS